MAFNHVLTLACIFSPASHTVCGGRQPDAIPDLLRSLNFLGSIELSSLDVEHHFGERLLERVSEGDLHFVALVPGELHGIICHWGGGR